MAITYVTTGPWGAGTGTPLDADVIDTNFYTVDQRITEIEDNPVEPIAPISMTLEGTQFSLGLSNGDTLGPITWSIIVPLWRGDWQPETSYQQLNYFVAPDGWTGFVLYDHVSDTEFDWAATTGDPPIALYKKLSQVDAEPGGGASFAGLTDVILTSIADGDIPVYDETTSAWLNYTPIEYTVLLPEFTGDTGSGGVKGIVPAPASGDAAAGKFLKADGTWAVAPGGDGATSLAGLTDVSIAGPTNNSLLQYHASDGKWHNAALSAIGGTVTSVATGTGLTGGPVETTGTISLASIADDRFLANTSGGSAAPIATTLTAALDSMVGATRGSILRRDAVGWTLLTPGSAGQYLKSGGTGADVSWDAPAGTGTVTEIDTGAGLTGGPIDETGTISFASIADQSLLANISGGSAAPEATTLTALLDDVLGGNRGQIIYRGAAAWLALSPGASGNFLQTKGTGADPIWSSVKGNSGGGSAGTTVTIWNLSCDLATAAALPACTYANGTLGVGATLTENANGALTVDGVAVSVSDRILIKDQSNAAHNGVYVVTATGSGGAAFVLTRATDFDQTSEILEGSSVYVDGGDANANTAWVQITGGSITLGSSSIEFEAIVAALPVSAQGEVLGNPNSFAAPAIPTDLARMLRASLGDGTAGQVITSGGTGVDPAWDDPTGGSGGFTAVTKTADYTVLAGDSGKSINNIGAGADIVLTLPAAASGLRFSAVVFASHYIKFLTDGTDTISIGTDTSAAGGYVRSTSAYSSIQIEAHGSGKWITSAREGPWSIDA